MSQSTFDQEKYKLFIYNDCYGGGNPRFNQDAKTYHDTLVGSVDEKIILTIEKFGTKCTRDEKYTRFGLCLCPIAFYNCLNITEYDGVEKPYIDYNLVLKTRIENYYQVHDIMTQETYLSFTNHSTEDVELIILEFEE